MEQTPKSIKLKNITIKVTEQGRIQIIDNATGKIKEG